MSSGSAIANLECEFNFSQEFRVWLMSILSKEAIGDSGVERFIDTVKLPANCNGLPIVWFTQTDEDYDDILAAGNCCTYPDAIFFAVEIVDRACNLSKVQNLARLLKRKGQAVCYELIGPRLGAQCIDVERAGDNYASINEDYLTNEYVISAMLFEVTPLYTLSQDSSGV